MGATRTTFTWLAGLLGAGAGLLVGVFSMYAIAALITKSRETQAYLTMLVVPSVALLCGVTGALSAAVLGGKRGIVVAIAGIGWLLVATTIALGYSWHHRARPINVRVRNESNVRLTGLQLGGDFRRSTRVGDLQPGDTSSAVPVDLDQPGGFDALEGRAGHGYVRHRIDAAAVKALDARDHTWIVSGSEGGLTYELRPD